MKQNIHKLERPVRIILGVGLIGLGVTLSLNGNWYWLALAGLGLVPLLTGSVGSCPAYSVLGVSTRKQP